MIRNIASTFVKIAVSGLILYFIFRNIDTAKFWTTVRSVNPLSVIFVALLFMGTQATSTYRWSVILRKDMYVPYRRLLSIYFIGMFFNNFLPTMIGGDLVKGYFLYKASGKGDISLASIFMDRYSGFTALMVITAFSLAFGYPLISGTGLPAVLGLLLLAFAALSLVIWVGPLHGWAMALMAKIHFYGINKKIDMFYNVLMSYKRHYDILLTIFACSLLVQGGVIVGYYFLARGLGMDVSIGYFFLFIPLTTVVSMLPISLSGLGFREGAFVYLFAKAGSTQEEALTLSLMWFAIMVLVSLIGGVEYIRTGGRKDLMIKEMKGGL